ncbi:MAG TPA: hypothetical protein DEQ84_03750 [Prevotellaceae bacterium]|nr:hypothetical protein [Prevotellaceae bacterium]
MQFVIAVEVVRIDALAVGENKHKQVVDARFRKNAQCGACFYVDAFETAIAEFEIHYGFLSYSAVFNAIVVRAAAQKQYRQQA